MKNLKWTKYYRSLICCYYSSLIAGLPIFIKSKAISKQEGSTECIISIKHVVWNYYWFLLLFFNFNLCFHIGTETKLISLPRYSRYQSSQLTCHLLMRFRVSFTLFLVNLNNIIFQVFRVVEVSFLEDFPYF